MTLASTTSERRDLFEQVIRQRGKAFTQLAFCLCRDKEQAAEICAEAFARAWPHWRDGKIDELGPYVRQMVVNLCRKAWRRQLISRHYESQLPTAIRSEAHSDFELIDAVLRLPPRQRVVVVLRYFEDLSEREIAELLSVAQGTVKSRMSRALAALRSAVEDDSYA